MRHHYFPLTLCAAVLLGACNQDTADDAEGAVAEHKCPEANADGVIEIQSGLSATILSNGFGRVAEMGDYAGVHADLWVFDEEQPDNKGAEVWSSGGVEPFEFTLGQGGLIEGWSLGIECMRLGETRELIIAPDLAYGARGRPPVPPNATLFYELELVTLQAPGEQAAAE